VQFTHRMMAYGLITVAVLHAVDCAWRGPRAVRAGAAALALLVLVQAALGIATLLWHVPLPLALAHQAGAVVVLVAATLHAHNLVAGNVEAEAVDDRNTHASLDRLGPEPMKPA